jgi:Tfp pilus assembly protein PilF
MKKQLMEQVERMQKIRDFLRENPDDSFLNHALALEHIKLGEDAAARPLFEKIVRIDPGYIGSYYHLGRIYEREEKFNQAKDIYARGIEEAKKVSDWLTVNELRSALDALEFD